MIYLDHAATTPVPRAVADAMYEVLTEQFGNPSSQYPMGLEMKRRVEVWRKTVADALGCGAKQLFFTSCGTEADNWAIQAACWQNRRLGRHIVTTAVEHSAMLEGCRWMEQQGWEVTYLTPDGEGVITAQQVLDAVRSDTALVSCMLVNNELGTVYPIQDIARGLAAKNPQTLLHTDAVQGFLEVPFAARTLGADFLTISAHKIGGPKGIGALYIGPRVKNPRPLLPGGGQEGGLRSGTEATAQIAGFAKAVELRTEGLEDKLRHMAEIKAYAKEQLSAIPDAINVESSAGEQTPRVAVKVRRENASRFGLTPAAIGGLVRGELTGSTATTLRMNGEEYDVTVSGDASGRAALDAAADRNGRQCAAELGRGRLYRAEPAVHRPKEPEGDRHHHRRK